MASACAAVLLLGGGDEEQAAAEPAAVAVAEAEVPEAAEEVPTDEIRYATPEPEDVEEARDQVSEALASAQRKEQRAHIEPGPDGIMPASAGDNGTFDKVPANHRGIQAENGLSPENSAILIDGTAIAPASAPYEVEQAIRAANAIVGKPYIWGGGHGSWNDRGYDCSGAVSYALGGAGLLGAPTNSTGLMGWGEKGPGEWITVYANPSHTYVVIAGLRWDTVGEASGSGPNWHAEEPYPTGYVVRHPPGL